MAEVGLVDYDLPVVSLCAVDARPQRYGHGHDRQSEVILMLAEKADSTGGACAHRGYLFPR